VPCAATDVGGSAFIIGDTGMIVPPKDPRALADAAVKLLTKKDLRIKLGKVARARIIKEFSIDKIAAKYEDLL
jgi:glycosyltransferase involved in cell wall biosynthesis